QPDSQQSAYQLPRERRHLAALRPKKIAGPGSHDYERSDTQFQQHGVVAQTRAGCALRNTLQSGNLALDDCRLLGRAHALIAFLVCAGSVIAIGSRTRCRRNCSSSTKLEASSNAPTAT